MAVTLNSSAVKSAHYEEAAETLEIALTTGRTYLYFDVPIDVYEGLLVARSQGAFYNAHIKDRFSFREVT